MAPLAHPRTLRSRAPGRAIASAAVACLACSGAPRVEIRTAEAEWPGATVETLLASVAKPVEAQLANVPGVVQLTSVVTPERVAWQWHVVGDPTRVATSDLAATEALRASQTQVPPEVNLHGWRRRGPVARFVLADERASPAELTRRAEVERSELLRQPGVTDVRVLGAVKEDVIVAVDVLRLAAAGLTFSDVVDGLRRGEPRFHSLEDIGAVAVGEFGGEIVRVSGVAEIALEVRPTGIARLGALPVVVLEVEGTPPESVGWTLNAAKRHDGGFRRSHPALGDLKEPGPTRGPADLWIAGAASWECPSGSCVWGAEDARCEEIRVFGPDEARTSAARDLQAALRNAPEVTGVTDDGSLTAQPARTVVVDWKRSADFGLSTRDVGEALRLVAGGVSVGSWVSDGADRDVRVATRLEDPREAVPLVQLRSPIGLVPLGAVVSVNEGVQTPAQWRQDLRARVSLEVCGRRWTDAEVAALVPSLPPGVTVERVD